MTERASSIDSLRSALLQLRLHQPGSQTASEASRTQIDVLLTRIASLTAALRAAPPGETSESDTAARLLLADVAMVAAQFRGQTTELGERLADALDRARVALEGSSKAPIL